MVGFGFVGSDDGDGVFFWVVVDFDIVVGVYDYFIWGGDVMSLFVC